MSLEGLNCSCGENAEFQGILYGYHFVKRISSHKMLTNEDNKFKITIKYQIKESSVPMKIGKHFTSDWFKKRI